LASAGTFPILFGVGVTAAVVAAGGADGSTGAAGTLETPEFEESTTVGGTGMGRDSRGAGVTRLVGDGAGGIEVVATPAEDGEPSAAFGIGGGGTGGVADGDGVAEGTATAGSGAADSGAGGGAMGTAAGMFSSTWPGNGIAIGTSGEPTAFSGCFEVLVNVGKSEGAAMVGLSGSEVAAAVGAAGTVVAFGSGAAGTAGTAAVAVSPEVAATFLSGGASDLAIAGASVAVGVA
jgi:hypothetical protein